MTAPVRKERRAKGPTGGQQAKGGFREIGGRTLEMWNTTRQFVIVEMGFVCLFGNPKVI